MSELRHGKRYRVTYEGTFEGFSHGAGRAQFRDDAGSARYAPTGATFELIPDPIKVGDVLTTVEQFEGLPDWTALRAADDSILAYDAHTDTLLLPGTHDPYPLKVAIKTFGGLRVIDIPEESS